MVREISHLFLLLFIYCTYLNVAALRRLRSNIQSMREQLDSLGLCFNWDRVSWKLRPKHQTDSLAVFTSSLLSCA